MSMAGSIPSKCPLKVSTILRQGCVLTAFLIPLKLSLTYISLIPLILLWLYTYRYSLKGILLSSEYKTVGIPIAIFLTVATISTFTGLRPLHSLPSLISLLFFSLTVPVFSSVAPIRPCITALVAGQSVAALHSFLATNPLINVPHLFLGQVTESGQLAIVIPLALGLVFQDLKHISVTKRLLLTLGSGTAILTLLAFAFQKDLGITTSMASVILICSLIALKIVAKNTTSTNSLPTTTISDNQRMDITIPTNLILYQLPLLASALIINLKRGPWLGVFSALVVFCALVSQRLLALIIAVVVVVGSAIPTVQQRLLESYEHFTISGGRSTIWRIGVELISEFPMGIGYHNSGILRRFSPEIPDSLKHFHNNFLNITAETGWLGLACFLWVIFALLSTSFRKGVPLISIAIGCSILSWQVAGLVEYNFGDSEITIMVWMLVGFLIQSARNSNDTRHTQEVTPL